MRKKIMTSFMMILLVVNSNAGNLLKCTQNYKGKTVHISEQLNLFLAQDDKNQEILVKLTFFKGEPEILNAGVIEVKGQEINYEMIFQREVTINGKSETPDYPINEAKKAANDVKIIITELGGHYISSRFFQHSHKMEAWIKAPISVVSDFLDRNVKDLVFAEKAKIVPSKSDYNIIQL